MAAIRRVIVLVNVLQLLSPAYAHKPQVDASLSPPANKRTKHVVAQHVSRHDAVQVQLVLNPAAQK
jgi:hypothetical protein